MFMGPYSDWYCLTQHGACTRRTRTPMLSVKCPLVLRIAYVYPWEKYWFIWTIQDAFVQNIRRFAVIYDANRVQTFVQKGGKNQIPNNCFQISSWLITFTGISRGLEVFNQSLEKRNCKINICFQSDFRKEN